MYDTEPDSADPGRRWEAPERVDPARCGTCGRTEVYFTVAGLGEFCSLRCGHKKALTQRVNGEAQDQDPR